MWMLKTARILLFASLGLSCVGMPLIFLDMLILVEYLELAALALLTVGLALMFSGIRMGYKELASLEPPKKDN